MGCHSLPLTLAGLQQLNTAVFKCSSLQHFYNVPAFDQLIHLHLSGKFTLPNLKALTSLEYFSVELRNSLTSIPFPKSIKYLTNLRSLYWATPANNLIVHSLDKCPQLKKLSLLAHSIIFPLEMGKLRLEILELECGRVTFPSTIVFWTALQHSLKERSPDRILQAFWKFLFNQLYQKTNTAYSVAYGWLHTYVF